jgi:hypothetical protein
MSEQAMKSLFCRISKVDEEKRTVTGIGASEAIDAEGEIFDYDTSKPYVEAWSQDAVRRSSAAAENSPDGKSYGNIREQHDVHKVAGKLSEPIVYDDAQKFVILKSYVSDDAAWKKCKDGSYTGFSICGPIVGDKWSDPDHPGVTRYTCAPIEFSLVDEPCNPDAIFTAVKAGGVTESRKFKTAAAVEKEATVAKASEAKKSMYDISDMASVISSLSWTQDGLAYERDQENDASPIPDKLKALISELSDLLVDLAREETSELVTAMKAAGAKKLAAQFASKVAGAGPTVVAKTKAKADPLAKCQKALGSIGECLGKTCKCQDLSKCFTKIAAAHADATDAVGQMAPDETDSTAGKAAGVAAGAAPITQKAEGQEAPKPEIEDEMDEATKAQIAAAETNSAKALEIATKTNEGLESIAKALEGLTGLIAGEPVAAKSVGTGATAVVSKEQENGGKPVAAPTNAQEAAKACLARPTVISEREAFGLNIGR